MSTYLEDIRENFKTFVPYYEQVIEQQELLAGLGNIPAYPPVVIADADYNSVTIARNNWTTNTDVHRLAISVFTINNIIPLKQALRDSPMLPDQWTEIQAHTTGDFDPFPDTVWLGYASIAEGLPIDLIILESEPAFSFPNQTPA